MGIQTLTRPIGITKFRPLWSYSIQTTKAMQATAADQRIYEQKELQPDRKQQRKVAEKNQQMQKHVRKISENHEFITRLQAEIGASAQSFIQQPPKGKKSRCK
jgi:uncharacterized FlaG/YvyC family protein